jgi:hypothetical protein
MANRRDRRQPATEREQALGVAGAGLLTVIIVLLARRQCPPSG